MGYKKTDPCLDKAFDDERLFVLMTRDFTSPQVVVEWIKLNIGKQSREKLIEALDCAIEMHEKQLEMFDRKEGNMRCSVCGIATKTNYPSCERGICPTRTSTTSN